MTDIIKTDTTTTDTASTNVEAAGSAAGALDARIELAWLAVKGARVVADSRPDPENRKTREQAERYLDTLLDARLASAS